MSEPHKTPDYWAEGFNKIIGLGETSVRKNHYPELLRRIGEMERFRTLLDHTPDMMFLVDRNDESIVDANQVAVRRLLGPLEPDAKPYLHDYLGADMIAEIENNKTLDGNLETVLDLIDAPKCEVEISLNTVKLKDGMFAIVVIRDIHVRKQFERSLKKAVEDTERANRAKSDFLAAMSHELRTPLNAVIGYAQMLQLGPSSELSDHQREYVDSILQGGTHLLGLVNDILDLVKIETSHIGLSLEGVDPFDVIRNCVDFSAPLGIDRNITFDLELDERPGVELYTDKTRIKQILLNLLSNAYKFNRAGGSVRVCGEVRDNRYFRISVTDEGPGIPEGDHDRVFQVFQRLDKDPYIAQEGTGIGLTVSKLLIERLAGQIDFVSSAGKGTMFWIDVPLASNKEVFYWTEDLSIGVDELDADHRVIIGYINKIALHNLTGDELTDEITKMTEFAEQHIAREERVMEAVDYPGLDEHRLFHRGLMNKMKSYLERNPDHTSPEALHDLRLQLRDWWQDHIAHEDAKIAEFAAKKRDKVQAVFDY